MKKSVLSLFIVTGLFLAGCSSSTVISFTVENYSTVDIKDAVVEVPLAEHEGVTSVRSLHVDIPFQIIDDGKSKSVKFVYDMKPGEIVNFELYNSPGSIVPQFTPRTYAELAHKPGDVYYDKKFRGNKFVKSNYYKVPKIHTDHDALFKYEGPGWESEKVGYRFYLDWRNATDIFGKKKNQLILDQVGTTDTVAKDDSYHNMQEWGMDIFKVGNSLGIGTIGMWADNKVNKVSVTDSITCAIPYTGPIEAKVVTTYYGWKVGEKKYDLVSSLSITAGSRLTKCMLDVSGNAENLVTGLAKSAGTEYIQSANKSGWNYIALYGKQSLAGPEDKLGIVLFYHSSELTEITEDEISHIVKLKPNSGKVTYYFAAAWEQEEGGIKSFEEFKNYIEETTNILNNPVIVGKK